MAAILAFLLLIARPIGAVVTFAGAGLSLAKRGTKAVGSGAATVATHPITKYLLVAVVLLAVNGGFFIAGQGNQKRFDAKRQAAQVVQYQKEAADAVAQANAARSAATQKFARGRFSNRPSIVPGRVYHGSDGFSRD